MITLLQGPAHGKALMLRRAPLLLRVTEHMGEFDGLDQHHDEAEPQERLHVYARQGKAGWMHIKAKKGGGFYASATYTYHKNQPPDAVMRSNKLWREWAILEASEVV